MASRVDLHTHTTASDGRLEPAALLEKASDMGIAFLGISDHDTTSGYDSILTLAALKKYPHLNLIPAIEINAEGDSACHILGYYIDTRDPTLQENLSLFRLLRRQRAEAMVQKLQRLGVSIDFAQVQAHCSGSSLGRPHIADALIAKGYVRNRQEAFDRFLKKGGPAYIPGEKPTAQESIELIHAAGGISVLAHPSYYLSDPFLEKLVHWGLRGLEVFYPEHSPALIQRYLQLAVSYRLVATGGSDYHGPRTGRSRLGCVSVPESVIDALHQARNS